MKRDHVLVYKLLSFVEEKGHRLFKGSIPIEGYERDEVIDHLYLLVDAGFVNLGQDTLASKGPLVLTWKGCDYSGRIESQEANGSTARAVAAETNELAEWTIVDRQLSFSLAVVGFARIPFSWGLLAKSTTVNSYPLISSARYQTENTEKHTRESHFNELIHR